MWFKNKETGNVWEIASKDLIKRLKKDDNYEVIEKEEENNTEKSITELSVKDAIKLVSECKETDMLKEWAEAEAKAENRESLLKRVESRINALSE
ncbi:hypothetical protein [Halocella sp. SP3-1]|uniref:hypothetical protein n=1 Tax=Halocella sp. SP3-1 TaxID=2382161 RepID=UPI000F74F51F|nr:hypothetical protein [Halocella sp. SP3-1]AZO96138.1 hypothetical protein D7D81_16930 [Halocella sp. SP3-1]